MKGNWSMTESSPIVNAGAAIVGTSNSETNSQTGEDTHIRRKSNEQDIITNLLEEENTPNATHRKNSSSVVDPDFINAPPRRNSIGKVNDIDALVRRSSVEDVLKAAKNEKNEEDERKKARRAEKAAERQRPAP